MNATVMIALLLGAPAFTAGLISGHDLPQLSTRPRALAACAAGGLAAGLLAVLVLTAGRAVGLVAEAPVLLALVGWNVLAGTVGAAAGYGYGRTLDPEHGSERPDGRWLVSVTLGGAIIFLLGTWIVTGLDPSSPAMSGPPPEPRGYTPPAHTNQPPYAVTASCARRLATPSAGRRPANCQWFVLDGDIAWMQDQVQQVFEWGDTCGIAMGADGAAISWNTTRVRHCLDPALPPLDRSARVLAAHLALVTPTTRSSCRAAIAALAAWPHTILEDEAALDRATDRADAVSVKAYLAKLDEDLAPGALGFGRAESRCRLV